MASIDGTAQDDQIPDTAGDDLIAALAGDDTITVTGGSDTVDGGDGTDRLVVDYSASGEDFRSIGGGFGTNPSITSTDGSPSVSYTGIESLDIRTGSGNDTLSGSSGSDVISSGSGNDVIDSVDRPESIFAASISPVSDTVDAGDGDDNVTGGRLDILDGGNGNDFLQINFGFDGQNLNPAGVNLTLDGNGIGTASDGTSIAGFEFVNLTLTNEIDTVDTGDVRASLDGQGGNDILTTGAGDDQIFGGGGDDQISSGAGADNLSGGAGNDTIEGGAGNDSLSLDPANEGLDIVNLGDGNDTVNFTGFNPTQIRVSFTSADVGNGNAFDGNNATNEDGGLAVRLQSEDANGNLVGDVSRYDDEGITFLEGTQGYTFDVRDLPSGAARGDQFKGVVLGTSGTDDLSFFPPFREAQAFYYNAGLGNDTITAGSGNDFLVGGGGEDLLTGSGGSDTIFGGGDTDQVVFAGNRSDYRAEQLSNGDIQITDLRSGSPDGTDLIRDVEGFAFATGFFTTLTLLASNPTEPTTPPPSTVPTAGPDVLTGTTGPDTIEGGLGADTVLGGMGDDSLNGNQGADLVRGGMGNDIVHGGMGNDAVLGDLGNDTAYGDLGSDQVEGGAGDDTLFGGQGVVSDLADGGDTVAGGEGNDVIGGNAGNDLVNGNQGNDIVNGNQGDDTVNGGQGNDEVRGGRGNDLVFGDRGNDVVFGDFGNDTLTGGDGNDTFVFGRGQGADVITDFNEAQGDRLDLQGQAFTIVSSPDGSATLVLEGGGTIVLQGVTPADFGADYLV